jgi:hypothetical protein
MSGERPSIGALSGTLRPESPVSQTLAGRIGMPNHGHNGPRIRAAGRRFADRRHIELHTAYFSPNAATRSTCRAPRTADQNLERALSS